MFFDHTLQQTYDNFSPTDTLLRVNLQVKHIILHHEDYHLLKCDAVQFGAGVRSYILLMKAVRSSETAILMYLTVRRHIQEDRKHHSYSCHNL